MERLAGLHPRNNTFPAEVLLELAAEAIAESGRHRPNRSSTRGSGTATCPSTSSTASPSSTRAITRCMAAAMIRAGVYPDLLDEAYGWGIEDMWRTPSMPWCLRPESLPSGPDDSLEEIATALAERQGSRWLRTALTAGHEGDHDVGGVAVEVLPPAVIDGRRPRIGVAGGDLDVTQGHAGVEGGHDEGGSQHVGMDDPEPGLLADGADPAVRRAPVEP